MIVILSESELAPRGVNPDESKETEFGLRSAAAALSGIAKIANIAKIDGSAVIETAFNLGNTNNVGNLGNRGNERGTVERWLITS
jgi:hypothetical protein